MFFKVNLKTSIVLLFIGSWYIGFSQFVVQNSGVTEDLHCVHFPALDTGYAGGVNGALIRTVDGGRHWAAIGDSIAEDINDLYFLSGDYGFVVGDENTFHKTDDGGKSWTSVPGLKEANYTSIHFVDSLHGFAVGHNLDGGIFCKTVDGGQTWTTRMIDQKYDGNGLAPGGERDDIYLTSLSFLDADNGLIAGFTYSYTYGKHPFICKTNDGGESFTDISPDDQRDDWYNGKEVVSISYMNDHDACAIMNTGSGTDFMFISDYGVKSFEKQVIPSNFSSRGRFFSSQFLGRFIGYFIGIIEGESQIIKTIDQGNTFMFLNPPTDYTLYASCFADQNNGYFVGEKGTIIYLADKTNIVYHADGQVDEDDPPFSVASLKRKNKIIQVHIYNLKRNNRHSFSISVYDSYGELLKVKPKKVKIYSDEIRIRARVEDLEPTTYFYTVNYSNRTLINGKLSLNSYAQTLR